MLACIDVSYTDTEALAGYLLFTNWAASQPHDQRVVSRPIAAPYCPGEFYRRELPPILCLMEGAPTSLEAIIIDGYVWLDRGHAGLGARLYEALGATIPVVGVAKNNWAGRTEPAKPDDPSRSIHVVRGTSAKPVYVTSAGIDVAVAAAHVNEMHGSHRIPTLLKAVDTLVRRAAGNQEAY